MPLEVVVSIETLGTLITFERTIDRLLTGLRSVHLLHVSCVTAVENGHHSASSNQGHLMIGARRAVHAGHDSSGHPIRLKRSIELLDGL